MDPLYNHTDFKFHPQITQIGCYWGVDRVVDHTEVYLLEGERLALVDTCTAPDPQKYIAPALANIGRSLADIDVIINTHGHWDHAGGNEAVRRAAPECEILIHPAERKIVDPDWLFDSMQLPVLELLGLHDDIEAGRRELRLLMGQPPEFTGLLSDGDVIDLGRGIELKVIHTPGHSPGCVSLYWEGEGIVITGDSAPGNSAIEGTVPIVMDPAVYDASLKRLLDLDLNLLCQGHHYTVPGMTRESIKHRPAGRQYLHKCREVARLYAETTYEVTNAGPDKPFLEISGEVFNRLRGPLGLRPDEQTGSISPLGTHIIYQNYRRALGG